MKRQMTVILSEHIYNVLEYLSDHHQASKDDLIEEAVQEYYSEEIDRGLRVKVAEQTEPTTEDCSMVDCGWK